jgi:prepilin signal peptidase PulO-like enzyme (type II secretory pathway)
MGVLFVVMAAKAFGVFNLVVPDKYWWELFDVRTMVDLVYYLAVGFLLAVIFVWDIKYMIIPDMLVVSGIVVTAVWMLFRYSIGDACRLTDMACSPLGALAGAAMVSGFFGLMFYLSRGRWIGGGDVKLGVWLGLIVGWQYVYFLLLITYVTGALAAIIMLALGSKKMKSQIPFGPFLVISTLGIILWNQQIMELWQQMIF